MLSLALKVALAPILVVAATLAVRRWGERVGGIIITIPIVAGPVLLVMAVDHGSDFVHRAATGALVGILCVCGFCLAYDRAAMHGVVAAVTAGWLTYFVLAVPLAEVHISPVLGLLVALIAIAVTRKLVSATEGGGEPRPLPPRFDLWIRAAVTCALVVTLTSAAGALGPGLSGVLTPFPVATTVVLAFTTAQSGGAAGRRALAGYLTGLPGFATFFLIVALVAA